MILAWFLDDDGESPVLLAMKRAGIGRPLPDGVMRLAEVEDLLELACAGQLDEDPNVFKPVVRNRYIWELVFEFSGLQFRMYLGEPSEAPGYIVVLHFHFKDISGSEDDIRAKQNAEIDIATRRFDSARSAGWQMLNGFS